MAVEETENTRIPVESIPKYPSWKSQNYSNCLHLLSISNESRHFEPDRLPPSLGRVTPTGGRHVVGRVESHGSQGLFHPERKLLASCL